MYQEFVSHPITFRAGLFHGQNCGTQIVAGPVDTVSPSKTLDKKQKKSWVEDSFNDSVPWDCS